MAASWSKALLTPLIILLKTSEAVSGTSNTLNFTAHLSPFLALPYTLFKNWYFSKESSCSINLSQLIPNLCSTPILRIKKSPTARLFQKDILLAPQINSVNPLYRSLSWLSIMKSKAWHEGFQRWGPYLAIRALYLYCLPSNLFQGSGSACGSPRGARPVLISTPCSCFVHWMEHAATGPTPPATHLQLYTLYTHLTFFTQMAAIHSLSFGTRITTTTHKHCLVHLTPPKLKLSPTTTYAFPSYCHSHTMVIM